MSSATAVDTTEVPPTPPEDELAGRRWVRRSVVAAAIVLFVLSAAGVAAYAYDQAHADQFLPGVTINGAAVGGRRASAVLHQLETPLSNLGETRVPIVAGSASASLTLEQMGLRSDAAAVVSRAEADASRMGLLGRVWHRALDKPVRRSYPVQLIVDRDAVRDHMIALAGDVHRDPVDAKIDTSSGHVNIVPAVDGRSLDLTAATNLVFAEGQRLARAPSALPLTVDVPLEATKAKITGFADVILVRTGENRLYHYENGVLVKTYAVATGQPRYPTPKGNFKIVLKRRLPTWVNPDPSGWGKSLPRSIPPGPGNPLGTRAMNLDAPGIRIHGTTNVRSLGTPASHGCIRMAMHDVEELFELVDSGTPVIVLVGPAAGAPVAPAPVTAIGDPNAPVDLEAG
jgi:lipoprotein-anchoring transpeptidase ErfK/SrfK